MNAHETAAAELVALQRADLIECRERPELFIERHVTIEEPDGQVIPFKLWPFQRKTITTLNDSPLAVVLKARRMGLSWVALALALWLAIFQQGIRILILCKTEGDAAELLDRVRRMRDRIAADPASQHLLAHLPRPDKLRDAVTMLDIGSSTIRALVGTPAAARSETAGLVIWDEAAFQRRAEKIWQGLLPTVEGGGRLWVISTGDHPRGDGAMFASLWQRAAKGLNGFANLFWPWDARPDRDQEWKRAQIEALGSEDSFQVEYPEQPDDAFISAGASHVYSREGIAAAVRLGAEFDDLRAQGKMPEPLGGALRVCADFGEQAHTLLLWPLERGGFYVVHEHHWAHKHKLDVEARPLIARAQETGWTVGRFLFDGSMPRDAEWFLDGLRTVYPLPGVARFVTPVSFSKWKRATVLYLRRLFQRAADGEKVGVIAISPRCELLISQLEGLEFKSDESEDVVKKDDHGPDALISGAAPEARAWRQIVERESGKETA